MAYAVRNDHIVSYGSTAYYPPSSGRRNRSPQESHCDVRICVCDDYRSSPPPPSSSHLVSSSVHVQVRHGGGSRRRSSRRCGRCGLDRSGGGPHMSSSGRSTATTTTSILVDNRASGSSLWHRYGPEFRVGISHSTSTSDIIGFLAPESSRYEVVVHWDDHTYEPLGRWIPVRDISRRAH
ncbi:hypothetical protein GMORB2_4634 [Geosmithia morbida]|uniref:Uncharacterized protein n=1 Tax=Geosmithia morbida TaxID=1094350 RepID=A0A9P4YR47_9HYPO|nr:uncharacterized protein GMORB2_4634 [Geosmithia morbida]KAF4119504.1 hypothetical protein GMORB2_4634 [Geosmithia morbida]